MRSSGWGRAGTAVALAGCCCCGWPAPPPNEAGLVVEGVEPGYAAARAGIAPGDVLEVASLPELAAHERRSEAGEALRIRRLSPAPGELVLPRGTWRIHARPPLPPSEAALQREARAAFDAGDVAGAGRAWAHLAERSRDRGDLPSAAWFELERSRALLRERRLEEARAAAREAIVAARSDGPELERWARRAWAERLDDASEHLAAGETCAELLAELPGTAALRRAGLEHRRGVALFRAGRSADAREPAQRAVELWRSLAPESAAASGALLLLARIERNDSRYDVAAELVERALGAARASDPGGPAEAAALGELGVIANRRGRLEEEERWGGEALALYDRLGVRDSASASVEMRLGIAAHRRGDVARAEERFRAALAAFETAAPVSVHVGWALIGLGHVQQARGDLEGALESFRRSARIRELLIPGTYDHAISLENVASVAAQRGELAEAERSLRGVLRMLDANAPETFTRARVLAGLAEVVASRGRLAEASALLERSLEMHRERAPDSLDHAEALFALGELEERAGRPAAAARAHRHALAVRSRLAPGSRMEAASLFAIGRLERAGGRRDAALSSLRRAVEALERQRERLGGAPEDRARFGATWAHVHRELLDLLLELGRDEAAFELLERYRVGSLGALLSLRDVRAGPRLPEPLRRQREALAREYEREAAALSRLTAVPDRRREVDASLYRLRALRARRARLLASVGEVLPELAALESPHPPSPAAAARLLGEGTLLLSFASLSDKTVLFALAGGASARLHTHVLPLAEADLRDRVQTLVDLIRSPHAPPEGRRSLEDRLAQLHRDLLGPVRESLARNRHLLVLPDGPLHRLPFGALVVEAGPQPVHLIRRHSLSRASSLTLLAASASRAGTDALVAFGDPAGAVEPWREGASGGLVHARAEVQELLRLFPRTARVFVGEEASEERAKSLAGEARYLHFACHAEADDRFPLDSYLALAPSPGEAGENGRLQAWEVYEELELRADVVTLSACETASGPELGGAGLLGLTYAFRYAGARAVLASLWPVSDRSTGTLMRAFYAELRSGVAPDEALRRAQVALIDAPLPRAGGWIARLRRLLRRPGSAEASLDASHPYYWASFQLFGSARDLHPAELPGEP